MTVKITQARAKFLQALHVENGFLRDLDAELVPLQAAAEDSNAQNEVTYHRTFIRERLDAIEKITGAVKFVTEPKP